MRRLLIKDRGRALERARHESAADLLSRESEAELGAGEERQCDAHDRGPVVPSTDPVLREGHHLFAVLVRRLDVHDGVLRAVVSRERVPLHAGPKRLDDRAVRGHDERAVIPVRVWRVLARESQPLTELDHPAEELTAVGEDEVSGPRIGIRLTGRNVLESGFHHRPSLTGHALCTRRSRGETPSYEASHFHHVRNRAPVGAEPLPTAQTAGEGHLRAEGRRSRQWRRQASAPDTREARSGETAGPHPSGETYKGAADRDPLRQTGAARRRPRSRRRDARRDAVAARRQSPTGPWEPAIEGKAQGPAALAESRIRADPTQVSLRRSLDRSDPTRAHHTIPPTAVDPVEAIRSHAVHDATDLVRRKRDQIGIAPHEAHEADIGHDRDRVTHQKRAAA